jgi:hypothetical protein
MSKHKKERKDDFGITRWLKFLPVIILLVGGAVTWTTMQLETKASQQDIAENKEAIEQNQATMDRTRETVFRMEERQKAIQNIQKEMSKDIKDVLRALNNRHASRDHEEN